MKKRETALSMDDTTILGARLYPHHPLPSWLREQVATMPVGFAAIAQTTLLSLGTIDLIQRSCALKRSLASQPLSLDRNDIFELMELLKEINHRCNNLLLHRNLNRVEEILALSLLAHFQYSAKDLALRFSIPAIGLGMSTLLFRVSCTLLARDYELMAALDLESPSVGNAMAWAGSMLVATSPEDEPAWTLGHRVLRLCGDKRTPDWSKNPSMCRTSFVWPETLPVWPHSTHTTK